ncbi:hypothetical protein H0H92_013225 [Tricholoma furcatifolium]|nr:hypothetical protein H0H92_013225 [Tricholoma furcatifolium]
MVQHRRRVSYIIPPPAEPVPRLQLPPYGVSLLGSTGPLLIPSRAPADVELPKISRHPRHRLGISSLVLDTSTQLTGRSAPEGILYSGGRDGLVISYDLGIPMKKRKAKQDDALRHRDWEVMTGWADEEELEDVQSDGDILGDVTLSPRRRQRINSQFIPYEKQWETDLAAYKPGKQNVISASSDGTVKSWRPHMPNSPNPSTIGTHSDYVRCLAHSREQNWVASGSFDRTIKLWDLTRESQMDPIVTFNPPDVNAPKSSIYALAADPFGTTIASGSPERVVRLWDPRTGKRTGKLVGHTDNIRAILISDDARYLLTGSADETDCREASIKLWSLATQRCLHTFTHHTESVWSLHSSHPSLEVFYSGDRAGLVCKVDVEDCSVISEGECVLLCHDVDQSIPTSDGINKIVAMDDNVLWTASGHSNIKRWSVPQRRSIRASTALFELDGERYARSESPSNFNSELPSEASTRPSTAHGPHNGSMAASMQSLPAEPWSPQSDRDDDSRLYGIPFESLIRLISPNESFAYCSAGAGRTRDPEVATLYSAASIKSVPRQAPVRSPTMTTFKSSALHSAKTEDTVHPVSSARADYEERELVNDAIPLHSEPEDVIVGEHGLVRSMILNDRVHALTVDTSGEVAVWDIVRGACLGRYSKEDVATASSPGSWTGGSSGGEREHSPREALETVRERIEGEAVVSQWATADTKAGVLTIHLMDKPFEAEVYADEVGYENDRRFTDESKINLGKWVLRNLFLGFIREEQRSRREQDEGESPSDTTRHPHLGKVHAPSRKSSTLFMNTGVVQSATMLAALPPIAAPPTRTSPLLASLIPLHTKEIGLPVSLQTALPMANDTPIMSRRHRSGTIDEGEPFTPPPPSSGNSEHLGGRTRQPSASGGTASPPDDFSAWGAKSESSQGGIMGRLKNFGKTKRPPSEASSSPVIGSLVPPAELIAASEDASRTIELDIAKSPVHAILSGALNPPPSSEAPTFTMPLNTTITISEEATPSYTTVYSGTVASTKHDIALLEEAIPLWLMEYLLLNRTPPIPPQPKVSFVLLPWPMPDGEEQLPELLDTTQSKLTSSRQIRVRKLVVHVQEKLAKILPQPVKEPPPYEDKPNEEPRPPAENEFEILCNDMVLHLGMSLAVVRQYVWKQSSELIMHYRRKSSSTPEKT